MEEISFSVDAGLINRLGIELVGRAETAVSELIKNAYDADANYVELDFIETNQEGGVLVITDDGNGMTESQLINGFMRISSGDKIENPISPIYKRSRAGKKGIGRFATQRLGKKLILTTQTKDSLKALQVVIDWEKYETSKELIEIKHPIQEIPKEKEQGTTLRIEDLREPWSEATIKRIFRYTSELIQPNYLSEKAKELRLANVDNEGSFEIRFYQSINNQKNIIADVNSLIFDFAIATIEGYIGKDKIGYCSVTSKRFSLNELYEISADDKGDAIIPFNQIKDIHFKAFYFIYNRPDYYDNTVPKILLNQIKEFAEEKSGLRLYRNGFRILPYGEPNDDWLDLDRRWSVESAAISIPWGNKNFFGFIEVIDKDTNNILFEETASREGLIRNEALEELENFLKKSLKKCRNVIGSSIEFKKARQERVRKEADRRTITQKLEDLDKNIQKIGKDLKDTLKESNQTSITIEQKVEIENTIKTFENTVSELIVESTNDINAIKEDVKSTIEELAMMRVLAGLGLTIAEFVHELQQFTPSFQGNLIFLANQKLDESVQKVITDLQKSFNRFRTYTSYFDKTISRNVQRELEPINIKIVINDFISTINADAISSEIHIEKNFKGFDLFTCPMHPSEWNALLFNLYTNAKKAIRRARVEGEILISAEEQKDKIFVEFLDNGDGIKEEYKERIFDAFFTTSQPNINGIGGELTGTGLGLKIVKDIIDAYNGEIYVAQAVNGFATCIHIEIPKATEKELEKYEN